MLWEKKKVIKINLGLKTPLEENGNAASTLSPLASFHDSSHLNCWSINTRAKWGFGFGGSEIQGNIIFQLFHSSLWNHGNHPGTELCSVSWTSRRPAETLSLPLTLTPEQKGGQPISHICSDMEVHPLLAVSLSPSLVCSWRVWLDIWYLKQLKHCVTQTGQSRQRFLPSLNSLYMKSTKVAAYVKDTCTNRTFQLHMHGLWFHTVWNDLRALWMFVLSVELFINSEHLYNFFSCLLTLKSMKEV